MVYLIAVIGGLLFGGADQYLGSIATLGPSAVAVSGMSAPWLALPFVFGLTRRDARHAAAIGLLATGTALLGYFAMMLSPVEGVTWSHVSLRLELTSQMHVILPGLVSGPFFGLCGWVWRWRRAWGAAAAVAGAFALEPLARWLAGALEPAPLVWAAEVLAGAGMAVWIARTRRHGGGSRACG
ncbi:MAG TPA: DUF6518 family protein [Solirubrobacteraceae bacterium]|nr:DUF6518 family protein [Solirubrobacteraceae bacterium]